MTTTYATKSVADKNATIIWAGEAISVIGIGAGTATTLGPLAIEAIQNAQILIGADHHLKIMDRYINTRETEFHFYPSPLFEVASLLIQNQHKKIVLLASGDPLFFGIGSWLTSLLGSNNLVFYPNVSSVQVACAKLGIPWDIVKVISLHGRPAISIRSYLQVNRYFAILPDKHSQPVQLAHELQYAGFSRSRIWVIEVIGTGREKITQYDVATLLDKQQYFSFDSLHVSLIEVRGKGGVLPEFPGIPDENFITDDKGSPGRGMISKREVRLTILSLLSPQAEDVAWDIGAGCGSVAIEWARWNKLGNVYAVESHVERIKCVQKNSEKFGVVKNLFVIHGVAPEILSTLPKPTVIFIGGSGGDLLALLTYCWSQLCSGGRLVVSALTEKSRADLYCFSQQDDIRESNANWTELSISKSDSLQGHIVLRPNFPVLLAKFEKK